MWDVFISYSTIDEELARFIRHRLTNEGLQVFSSPGISTGR
jgi:hypothetical protein